MIETLDKIAKSIGRHQGGVITGIYGRQQDSKGNRTYSKPGNPEDIRDSVTRILESTNSKPWNGPWRSDLAARTAVDNLELVMALIDHGGQVWVDDEANLEELEEIRSKDGLDGIEKRKQRAGREVAIKWIKDQAKIMSELKADLGSYQHDVLEALGLDVSIPPIPEHLLGQEVDGEIVDKSMLDGISDGLLHWHTDFDFDLIMAEATVANAMYNYAGTLDLVVFVRNLKQLSRFIKMTPELKAKAEEQGGLYLLIDLKAGKNLSDTMRAQLAAYWRCDEVWIDDLGNTVAMPEIDAAAILHLRQNYPRGYKLIQVSADDDDFDWFLHCQEILRSQSRGPHIHAGVLYPPLEDGSQPLPFLRDIYTDGFGRARSAICKAGFETIEDLTSVTKDELLTFKGVGEAYVAAAQIMLAEFGLSLRQESTPTQDTQQEEVA